MKNFVAYARVGSPEQIEGDMKMKSETLKIVIVEPNKPAKVEVVPNTLQAIQGIVGGYIETVFLPTGHILVCNEEGKLKGLEPNRKVGRDIICGTFFITKQDGEDFGDLTEEDVNLLLGTFSTY